MKSSNHPTMTIQFTRILTESYTLVFTHTNIHWLNIIIGIKHIEPLLHPSQDPRLQSHVQHSIWYDARLVSSAIYVASRLTTIFGRHNKIAKDIVNYFISIYSQTVLIEQYSNGLKSSHDFLLDIMTISQIIGHHCTYWRKLFSLPFIRIKIIQGDVILLTLDNTICKS